MTSEAEGNRSNREENIDGEKDVVGKKERRGVGLKGARVDGGKEGEGTAKDGREEEQRRNTDKRKREREAEGGKGAESET